MGNHLRNPFRPPLSGFVAIEADINVRNFSKRLSPLRPKRTGAAGRSHRTKSPAFEHEPVEFALADDDTLRFGEHTLPAIEFSVRARSGEHLRTVGLVFRIFAQLEKGDIAGAVTDWDRDARAVPAEQVFVYCRIRNPAAVEVATDEVGQRGVKRDGLIEQVWTLRHCF